MGDPVGNATKIKLEAVKEGEFVIELKLGGIGTSLRTVIDTGSADLWISDEWHIPSYVRFEYLIN